MTTARRMSVFEQWAAVHADVVEFLAADRFDAEGSRFLADMAGRVRHEVPLTPKQTRAVRDNMVRRALRTTQESAAAPRPGDRPAPSGRHLVVGTVTAVHASPGYHDAIEHKMVVDAGTFRVWCTVPARLLTQTRALVGRRVRFTAELSPAEGNPSFAIGSAPRSARVLPAEHLTDPADDPAWCAA